MTVPNALVGKKIYAANLVIHVGVQARVVNDFVDSTPMIEVYKLKGTTLTNANEDLEFPSSGQRSVGLGSDQRVRLHVTDLIRGFARNPIQWIRCL